MITSNQKIEGCIALNKLKLLISETACIYDLKSLYTAIETGIDTAVAGGGAAGDTSASGGGTGSTPATGGAASATTTNISVTWLETKLAELKSEIELTLTEITNQIQNNI